MNNSGSLLLLGPYPPPFGGVSVHLVRLAQLLERSGVRYRILSTTKATGPGPVVSSRSRLHFLKHCLQYTSEASCIHDHTEFYQWKSMIVSLFFFSIMNRSSVPHILTIHDGTFCDRVRSVHPLVRFLIRSRLRRYAAIIVINNELRETTRILGIDQGRVFLIKSFLPFSREAVSSSHSFHAFFSSHKPILMSIGAFHEVYHFDVVAEAFLQVRARYPSGGLVLVAGSFTQSDKIRRALQKLMAGGQNPVLVVHDLPPETTLALIRDSDVFIRSAFPDGDGMSMREALLLGTPVIATETGDRPDDVPTYPADNSASLAHQVIALLSHDADRRALSERTARESQTFAEALLKLYATHLQPSSS